MAGVFISYRRVDTAGFAGRLWEHLRRDLRPHAVFMDIEGGIPRGDDFADTIAHALESAHALVVIIGPHWLGCRDAQGARRIDNPHDWVRTEIAKALARGIFVLPVLVDGAVMPTAAELPGEIHALARRQAADIRNSSWEYDVHQIADSLTRKLPATRPLFARPVVVGAALVLLAIVGSFLAWWLVRVPPAPVAITQSTPPVSTSPRAEPKPAPPAITSPLPPELVVPQRWHPVSAPEIARVTTGDFVSPRVGWVAGKQGLLIMTADGGNTWTHLTPGVTGDIRSVNLLDSETGWVLDSNGTLAGSRDGGKTWSRTTLEGMRLVKFFDRRNGLVAGSNATASLRYSADGGRHWQTSQMPQGFSMTAPTALAVGTDGRAWVTPFGSFKVGGVLATVNAGRSWTVQPTHNVYYLSGLSMQDGMHGWMIGYVFGKTFGNTVCEQYTSVVFRTSTGGDSWDPVGAGICGFSGAVAFVDHDRGWISVRSKDGSQIFATDNGGINWTKQQDVPAPIGGMQRFNDGSGWVVAEGVLLRFAN